MDTGAATARALEMRPLSGCRGQATTPGARDASPPMQTVPPPHPACGPYVVVVAVAVDLVVVMTAVGATPGRCVDLDAPCCTSAQPLYPGFLWPALVGLARPAELGRWTAGTAEAATGRILARLAGWPVVVSTPVADDWPVMGRRGIPSCCLLFACDWWGSLLGEMAVDGRSLGRLRTPAIFFPRM